MHGMPPVVFVFFQVKVESRRSEEAEAVEADARSTLKVEDAAIDSEN